MDPFEHSASAGFVCTADTTDETNLVVFFSPMTDIMFFLTASLARYVAIPVFGLVVTAFAITSPFYL